MMHELYKEWNLFSSCMKSKKYNNSVCFKYYFKFLQSEIIVHKNGYSLYHHETDEHKVIKQMNEIKMIINNK